MEKWPARVLTIRYEDFLSDQETVLRRICAFFGIAFLPQMLDVSHSAEAQQISRMSALWESNCFAPIMANKDKFLSQLRLEEIDAIESICGDWMDLYGYERMTKAVTHLSPSMLEEAKATSALKRSEAWIRLKENNFKDFILRRFRADYLNSLATRLI